MAITFVAAGSFAAAAVAITPGLPAGIANDDILIGVGECNGNQVLTPPTGWAHVTGSPVNVDTTTRLTVMWKRVVGGETALSWGDSGDHNIGQIVAFRGVKATGNPWNATPTTATEATLDTSAAWPTVTTTAADCMIVLCIATGRDATSAVNVGAVTNANLTTITERLDAWNSVGAGGGIGVVTGFKVAAGAVGASTATMGSTDAKALMTLPLEPAPAAAVPPVVFMRMANRLVEGRP